MPITVEYASFLIRIWREKRREKDPVGDWKIQVEHIQKGNRRQFSTFDEMVHYLHKEVEKYEMLPSSNLFACQEARLTDAENQLQEQGQTAAGGRENEGEGQANI